MCDIPDRSIVWLEGATEVADELGMTSVAELEGIEPAAFGGTTATELGGATTRELEVAGTPGPFSVDDGKVIELTSASMLDGIDADSVALFKRSDGIAEDRDKVILTGSYGKPP
jgi:hypothetical protein